MICVKRFTLSPLAFKVLRYLVRRVGEDVTAQVMLRDLWHTGDINKKHCVAQCISMIRQKVPGVQLTGIISVGFRLESIAGLTYEIEDDACKDTPDQTDALLQPVRPASVDGLDRHAQSSNVRARSGGRNWPTPF